VTVAPSLFLALVCAAPLAAQADPKPLVVHEWGTFTVLQDETGDALPGVNINEESLPKFVHRLSPDLAPDSHELAPVLGLGTHRRFASKGIARSFPGARMRMETPILYFYPPTSEPFEVDVRVDFHRGWISEWYPDAVSDAPGFSAKKPRLPADRSGSISWTGLRVGSNRPVPHTGSNVWLAPRIHAPATVATKAGQAERYLFYRGVADLPAPLRVIRDGDALCIEANGNDQRGFHYPVLWLADIRADGRIAFRELPAIDADAGDVLQRVPARFDGAAYRKPGRLRESMSRALRSAGLFAAEAKAMLDTWQISYFQSPGLRLFFVLPRKWVDKILPLSLSRGASIERVMVGRIELITPEQRELARRIANLPEASKNDWFHKDLMALPAEKRNPTIAALTAGSMHLHDLDFEVPEDYRTYLAIGRFRDAIMLQEAKLRPTKTLTDFIANYQLRYFD